MQVDWVSAVLDPGPLWPAGLKMFETGQLLEVSPDGEIVKRRGLAVLHEGSHDSRLMVASHDGAQLYLSGNPAKYFQGHNLFGSDDAWGLWLAAGIDVGRRSFRSGRSLFPSPFGVQLFSPPRFTRVDLTRSYRFPSDAQAREWLRDVAASARSRHGGALVKGSTVYFGKNSTRWAFKVYAKADELQARGKGHALSAMLPESARFELSDWARGVVRFELTLRSKELAKLGQQWDAVTVWREYYERLTWNRNVDVIEELDMIDESKLTHSQAGYLARWRFGEDLRRKMSKTAFYRARSGILAAVGVDIASAPPPREKSAPAPSQRVSAVLDPAGWDPEPIKAHVFEPDPDDALKRSYRLL